MSAFDLQPSTTFTFLSPEFWGFFGMVLVGLWASERNLRMRNAFLFLVSLLFYWKTNGWFVALLLGSTAIDWSISWRIHATIGVKRKAWLAASIVANLGLLGFFKYAYFFTDALNPILGTHWSPHLALGQWSNAHLGTTFRVDQILLPVGISFYTFQTLSYSIDVYRKQIEPCRSFLDFGFFVSFFPQLVAGPIVRAKDFIPQLHRPYSLTRPEFGMALFWILNGLLKKVWLADYLAVNLVDRIFAIPGSYSGFENILGLYAYSLQVYADFSGYTDMAIGIALLLGFTLPLNFKSPYKARNVGEFWQRWHISLSTWLKDYLYIPMGGNRGASLFTAISLGCFLVFLFLMLPSLGNAAHCNGPDSYHRSTVVGHSQHTHPIQHQYQSDDDHAHRWPLAWRKLELCPVGRTQWAGPHRIQGLAKNQSMGTKKSYLAARSRHHLNLSLHFCDQNLVPVRQSSELERPE